MEENAPALKVFLSCQTQWRYSARGATGLDYNVVLGIASRRWNKPRTQLRILDQVRLIESGALSAISKLRERNG